ncbi:uncharacterized protein LOC143891980 [Tasmannia lanceolata]|uniref:uncharacterized protein LOC143891980 n=1 Tax=Tasmannia lanceolata TaxID=3420 RepID=UPI0040633025
MPITIFSLNTDAEDIHSLEIQAIYTGVIQARKLGINSLWIEADSFLAVNVINGSGSGPWKKQAMIREIIEHLRNFSSWKLTHVWRESNAATDYLSKRSCPWKGEDIPLPLVPEKLLSIMTDDRMGTVYIRL